jgi:hypothetical protein
MKKNQENDIPEFKTLEEEREYWESRSGLADGHKGRLSHAKEPWSERKTKRSSFLVVRLTAAEIDRLHSIATKEGVGVSTCARKVLINFMEREEKADANVSLDDVKQAAEDFISGYAALKRTSRDDVLVARGRERDKTK